MVIYSLDPLVRNIDGVEIAN